MYEGKTRRFTVTSVRAYGEADDDADLAAGVQALSLTDAPPKLWTVGWETTVVLEGESSKTAASDEAAANVVRQVRIRVCPR